MNIFTQPEAMTFLADHYDGGRHPWPFFWIFPLLFWVTFIVIVNALPLRVRQGCRRPANR